MAEMPKDASDLFDNKLPAQLAANPDKAKAVGAKYAFKITGEGGGEWTVDLAGAVPSVKQGIDGPANCTIEVAHEDFKNMLSNPAAGMQLFFAGKLRVTGDMMLATKLQQLFKM
jgi:putative sterol carrier protein